MEFHGNIDMRGNSMQRMNMSVETQFPADASPGRWCFLATGQDSATVYFCVEIAGGLPVWVPMSRQITMKRHTQSLAAIEWVIPHTLNISTPMVQVFDTTGKAITPSQIICNEVNKVTVIFDEPTAGTAVIMRGETEGSEQPLIAFQVAFENLDTWVINHQLGYNPTIQCVIGNNVVQPQSIVHNSTMQATVTWSSPRSGYVRCI